MNKVFKIEICAFLLIVFTCSCGLWKSNKIMFCNKQLDFKENKIIVKKIDTLNYEEGDVYSITTDDKSLILILCGGNGSLLDEQKYVVMDSMYIGKSLILNGFNSETKLFWRKHKNMAYVEVKDKDTLRYNRLLKNAYR